MVGLSIATRAVCQYVSIDFSSARAKVAQNLRICHLIIPHWESPFFWWCTNRKGSWIGRQPIMHLRISCRWQMTQQLSLSMYSLSTHVEFLKKVVRNRYRHISCILTNLWNISKLQQHTLPTCILTHEIWGHVSLRSVLEKCNGTPLKTWKPKTSKDRPTKTWPLWIADLVDGRNPANQLIGSLSHYLRLLYIPGGDRSISSIKSIAAKQYKYLMNSLPTWLGQLAG